MMRDNLEEFQGYKKIAVMGGTFDPIHYGHLVTAEEVCHKFQVDKVIFIPTGTPAYKENQGVSESEYRYHMTCLGTSNDEKFKVSKIEIERQGNTYTVDTMKLLKQVCSSDIKIYFIMGADSLHQIMNWKEPELLMTLCDFIVVTRPGYDKKTLVEKVDELNTKFSCTIHFMEVPALDISSSQIRMRVRNNQPIKYLLPEKVENYILETELYKK